MIDRLPILLKQYEEIKAMTQQFFKDPNECLKWCIDHPGQRCRDGEGRKVWFLLDIKNNSALRFCTNIDGSGEVYTTEEESNLFPSDLKHFDLTTLRPEPEPEKPTLDNLAAGTLESWDWFKVTLPNGRAFTDKRYGEKWSVGYFWLQTALEAGWPVEFGRGEA